MRFGVVVFPGSNCDHDAWYAVSHNLGQQAEFIWHDSTNLNNLDAVILPGGFAYGDYLRCGAIAKFSPVMQSVKKFARDGGLVLGICNGFQILRRERTAPRSPGTEPAPEVYLPHDSHSHRDDQFTFHRARREESGPASTDRSWRRLLYRRRSDARSTRVRGSRAVPLSRRIRTAPCGTSRVSSTKAAT